MCPDSPPNADVSLLMFVFYVDGHFRCFQMLAMVNIAGVQDCQPVSFSFSSSEAIGPAVGMPDWMVAQYLPFQGSLFVFSLLALTMSHFEPRVHISPQPLQHLFFAEILLMAILTGVSWQEFVIWICMSLIIPNVQHFSTPILYLLNKNRKKNCEYSKPLEIVFLERCPLLNFLVDFRPQEFFWGQVSFTGLQWVWIFSDH